MDSENSIGTASSPTIARRRRNTEGSETSDDVEKTIDRQRSFSCTKLKQHVEIFNFSSKLGDRTVHCGKCVGMYMSYDVYGNCLRTFIAYLLDP